ncbi:MAG: biotin--[acetyl-CoA-carboxylase] ligase [Spirochaetales bacterium]|nr:MAG: biotin--[acetyl-CoA-carboxylase] ligase [Spirochaetales bacterium]
MKSRHLLSHYIPLAVHNPFSGAPVLSAGETGSTMEDAEACLEGAPLSGTVLAASYQTRGVGRKEGRIWHAEKGMNLLFTLLVNKEDINLQPQLVPLAAGLGLSRFLENEYAVAPLIKWPNDVLIDGKKIAGILCRFNGGWFLVGIGVNINQAAFPARLQNPATSLYLETGTITDPVSLLPRLLQNLRESLSDGGWREEVQSRLFGTGKEVLVCGGRRPDDGVAGDYPAVIRGIDEEGRLLVTSRDSAELIALAGGEISIARLNPGLHRKITQHMTELLGSLRESFDKSPGFTQNLGAVYTALTRLPGLSLPDSFSLGRYAAAFVEKLPGPDPKEMSFFSDEPRSFKTGGRLLDLWFMEIFWMMRFRAGPGPWVKEETSLSEEDHAAVLRGALRSGVKTGLPFILRHPDVSSVSGSYAADLLRLHIHDGGREEIIKALKDRVPPRPGQEGMLLFLLQVSAELRLPVFGKSLLRRLLTEPGGDGGLFFAALAFVDRLAMRNFIPLLEEQLFGIRTGEARKLLLISALAGLYAGAPGGLPNYLPAVSEKLSAGLDASRLLLNHLECCLRGGGGNADSGRGLRVLQCSCIDRSRMPGEGNSGGMNVFILALGDALAREPGIGTVYTLQMVNLAEPLHLESLLEERTPGHVVIGVPVYLPEGINQFSLMKRQYHIEHWAERTLSLYGIKPDLFHLRYTHNGSMALMNAARRMKVPAVFTLTSDPHVQLSQKYGQFSASGGQPEDLSFDLHRVFLSDRILSGADGVVVLSQGHGLGNIYSFFPQFGLDPQLSKKPLKLVSEGIDMSTEGLPGFSREDFMRLMSSQDYDGPGFPFRLDREHVDRPCILNAGRLHPVKQQHLLAEAWISSGLWKVYNLVIVGGKAVNPGKEERDIIEKIALLAAGNPQVKGRFAVLGAMENRKLRSLEHWITENIAGPLPHVYACSSYKEEFGIAILEAMEAGFLMFGPVRGGLPGYITHGENGFLMKTDSAEDIADTLSSILLSGTGDTRKLREIALHGSREIREHYNISRVVRDYSSFYKEVVRHGM